MREFATFSAWLFYVGNVALVAIYAVLIALLLRPPVFLGRQWLPPAVTALACSYFAVSMASSIILAAHAYLGTSILSPEGQIDPFYGATESVKTFILLGWIYAAARAVPPAPFVVVDRPRS